jgi:hypothetical protein
LFYPIKFKKLETACNNLAKEMMEESNEMVWRS